MGALSMWPRGRLILIMLDMLDWDTPDMEAMEDMVLAMEVTLDMLDMEDMAMDMVLLATLSITMLPTLRSPPLRPFPSLEQPLLLCLESWEPEPMLELVAMLLTLLALSMWPKQISKLVIFDLLVT